MREDKEFVQLSTTKNCRRYECECELCTIQSSGITHFPRFHEAFSIKKHNQYIYSVSPVLRFNANIATTKNGGKIHFDLQSKCNLWIRTSTCVRFPKANANKSNMPYLHIVTGKKMCAFSLRI